MRQCLESRHLENQAEIVVCQNNFHGRTTTIISFSSDVVAQKDFGPFTPGFITIPYNDPVALEKVLHERPNIVGFLVEPIQGEAGVNTPSDDFMRKSQENPESPKSKSVKRKECNALEAFSVHVKRGRKSNHGGVNCIGGGSWCNCCFR